MISHYGNNTYMSLGAKSPVSPLARLTVRPKTSELVNIKILVHDMKPHFYNNQISTMIWSEISNTYMGLGLKSPVSGLRSGLRGVNHKSKNVRRPKLHFKSL